VPNSSKNNILTAKTEILQKIISKCIYQRLVRPIFNYVRKKTSRKIKRGALPDNTTPLGNLPRAKDNYHVDFIEYF